MLVVFEDDNYGDFDDTTGRPPRGFVSLQLQGDNSPDHPVDV